MEGTEHFTRTIAEYPNQCAIIDPLFALNPQKPNKSIKECITYILNEVQRSGCNGFADDEIYSMAVHCYDKDSIEVGNPISCRVAVNHVMELAEKEKAGARQEVLHRYRYEQYQQLSKRAKARATKQAEAVTIQKTLFRSMKSRTILQKEVAELSHHLPEITATQEERAKEPILRGCLYR